MKLLTKAAARLLDKSEQTVQNYADRGRLTVERTSTGTRLYDEEDVKRLAREIKQAKKK
jgi:DNA-binding transcriptional MerR regulator